MNINISLILSTGALAMTDAFRQDSHKLLRAPNVPIATTGGSPSSLVPLLPLSKEAALSDIGDAKGADLHPGSSRSLIALGGSWNQVGGDIIGKSNMDNAIQCAISGDGNRIVVGAPWKDTSGTDKGHVTVYDRVGDDWEQVGDEIWGVGVQDFAGFTVISDDGSTIAVGAPGVGPYGLVRVYEWNGNKWTIRGNLIQGEPGAQQFGRDVSLSGDGKAIVIGEHETDTRTGKASVYTYDGTSWVKVGSVSGENELDRFGLSVAISDDGKTVAMGCLACNSVPVYDISDPDIGLDRIGFFYGENAGDNVGCGVSLSSNGNIIAIGACGGDSISQVKVFQKDGASWPQYGNAIDGISAADHYGRSLSLSSDGQTLAVLTTTTDYLRVFSLVGDDWKQAGPDIRGLGYTGDGQDFKVGLSGDGTTVVASGYTNPATDRRGRIRVYDYEPQTMGEYLESASKAHQITADTGSVMFSQREIKFNLKVSKPVAGETVHVPQISVYQFDCKTPISIEGAVIATNDGDISDTEVIDGTEYDVRPVVVDVDVTKFASAPGIFEYLNDGFQGKLKICVKADIGSITIDQASETTSPISFVKVMFDILINMSEDFSNADYTVTVEESSAVGGTEQEVEVDYGLSACPCNVETKDCAADTKVNQNDPFAICIKTDSTDVIIKGLPVLKFVQGLLSYEVVKDSGAKDVSITSMSAFDSNSEVVVSRMLSIFFNSESSSVVVEGTALLEFISGGSRQLTSFGAAAADRELQGLSNEGEDTFEVTVELDDASDVDEASATLSSAGFSCGIAAMVVFVVAMM